MSFIFDNNLVFIDSFQLLSSSLASLVKNFAKNDFKHSSQVSDSEVLDLVKQKRFYPYEYMWDFGKFNEPLPSENDFYSSLSDKGTTEGEYQYFLKVWNKFEMETMKYYHK